MANARPSYALAIAGLVLAAIVVVLGAYTRLVDAGLGCPDWPGCYGHLGVPTTSAEVSRAEAAYPQAPVDAEKAWTEMVHRYAAATLGLVVLAILIVTLKQRLPWRLPAALSALVVIQGAFGAWTVTLRLWPQVVTAHLLGGFGTLALLWLLVLRLDRARPRERLSPKSLVPVDSSLRRLAYAALIVLAVQVALGGWVSSNYAALACPDFPTCHGEWLPDMDIAAGFNVAQGIGPNYLGGLLASDARVAIHVAHRLGAVAVLLVVGILAWRLGRRPVAWTLGVSLAVQLALGVANVAFSLPLAVAVLHNAGAAFLLLALVSVALAAAPPAAASPS